MMAAWMAWTVLVALLIGLAARALEALLEMWRLPRRGVWAGAMIGTLAAGALGLWRLAAGGASGPASLTGLWPGTVDAGPAAGPGRAPPAPGPIEGALSAVSEAITAGAGALPLPDAALVGGWVAMSAIGLALWAVGHRRLGALAAAGTADEVEGTPVRRTDETGPAVAGLLRPRILWPAWADALDPGSRRTMLVHEREHVVARDPALLAAGLAVAAVLPWNPLVWWHYRRLRRAVEIDCDRRVLDRAVERGAYASLLLDVAERRVLRLPALALVPPENQLRERIDAMTASRPSHPRLRSVALAAAALALAAVACETPVPVQVVDEVNPEGRTVQDATAEVRADSIRIRGDGKVLTGAEPLVFVDGERVPGGVRAVTPDGDGNGRTRGSSDLRRLNELHPDEIESIEILKGPAAIEAYGEKAAAGVILISTRSGGE